MSVKWTHNNKLLDKSRYSGLSHKVDTNITLSSNISMSSILTSFSSSVNIVVAMDKDGGNYTCRPETMTPTIITLHVIDNKGEHRLPMLNSDGCIVRGESLTVQTVLVMMMLTDLTKI